MNRLFLVLILCFVVSLGCSQKKETSQTVTAEESDGLIKFYSADRKMLSFATEQVLPSDTLASYYARDGFIHPLYSPKGVVLTAGYPRGHVHQHGIFHAWTRATVKDETIDFWNQHSELGTVELRSYQVDGDRLDADLRYLAYVDGDTMEVAEETWQVTVASHSEVYNLVDVEIRQHALLDSLHIQEYHYGGFAFRGSESWNLEGTDDTPYDSLAFVVTSLGDDHLSSNHTRPTWVSMWGIVEGDTAGVAIISHPSNFRHPQPVRVHPIMPYFAFAPMVLGEFYVQSDEAYQARYRIVSYDGEPDLEMIRRIEEDFGRK